MKVTNMTGPNGNKVPNQFIALAVYIAARLRDKQGCPDCGFWLACPKCSDKYDRIDRP